MSIALIAGTGDLPSALVARMEQRPLICAMNGNKPDLKPDMEFRLEHLGSLLEKLKAAKITEVCMAGAVRRPKIDPNAINDLTKPLVPKIMEAMSSGDDGALRAIIAIFEVAGFSVKAAHEIAPDLLPTPGILVGHVSETAKADALIGDQTLALMGRADLGQACVIRSGWVLVQEDDDGTDAMLMQLRTRLATGLRQPDQGIEAKGSVLFKAPKPNQDRRADLPVIGPNTAALGGAAGLAGFIIEAGGVMVLNKDRVVRILAENDMFLWVRERGQT